MQLDVQWFVSALIDNEMLSLEDAEAVNQQLGGEPDLGTFAQTLLEQATEGMSQEDMDALTASFQQILDFAVEQAATGVVPDIFANKGTPAPAAPAKSTVPPPPPAAASQPQPEPTKIEGFSLSEGLSGADFSCFDNMESKTDEELAKMLKGLLLQLSQIGASDLHISAKSCPFIRRSLNIERISDKIITPEMSERLNFSVLTPERKKRIQDDFDMNYALEFDDNRFRVALMYQKDGLSGSYRIVPKKVKSLEELGFLPKDIDTIKRLMDFPNGLVLVTGPIGAGKTTTLASLINICNENREDHVISVEDPVEIVQPPIHCKITQRQLHDNTETYSAALRGALRQDPDIIVIGELFDLETIEMAISAAETGHLVIGTLHTCDAANTLNRLLDVFPPTQQPQIRAMTAGSLRGVVCQKLIPDINGKLTVAYEILINTLSVGAVIAEGKNFKLKGEMQIGQRAGMCTMDANLLEKYRANQITYETALANMIDSTTMQELKMEMAKREAQKLAAAAQARAAEQGK